MNNKFTTKQFYVLGTICSLLAYGENSQQSVDHASERLMEIDDKMSVFKDDSEVSMVNHNAEITPQRVSLDTFEVVKKALYYSELTNGAFNPCIMSVLDLWRIGTETGSIPNEADILNAMELSSYKNVILDDENVTIYSKNSNSSIDLGGIAKGYAADEVKKIFKKSNISSALIDLGGNIQTLGCNLGGIPWNIGIQDPLNETGETVGLLHIMDKSVVTSGKYERFFECMGKRFHHIIDPNTGYPCENNILSVTVICENSMTADALSTAVLVMGNENGMELIKKMPQAEMIIINENKEIILSDGIKDSFEITNSKYSTLRLE